MTEADQRKAERDQRLTEFSKAVNEWADVEIKRLENEVTFLKSILDGRTGAGRLANQNVADASKYLNDEITRYLEE